MFALKFQTRETAVFRPIRVGSVISTIGLIIANVRVCQRLICLSFHPLKRSLMFSIPPG